MLDDAADRDAPFTGRRSLGVPVDLWDDFARTARRETHRGLDAFATVMAMLVSIGFLALAVHTAAADPTRSDRPPAAVYTPPPAATPTAQR